MITQRGNQIRVMRRVLYGLLVAYWGFICFLTHTPKLPPITMEVKDKTAHFLAYGALGGLVYLCVWVMRPRWRFIPLVVMAVAMVYGALDEWTQPWFGRDCDLYDWFADLKGAGIAAVSMGAIQLAWAMLYRPANRLQQPAADLR